MSDSQGIGPAMLGTIIAVVTAAATAGAVYGAIGGDVTRNAEDIAELKESDALFVQELKAHGVLLSEIRIDQRGAMVERETLSDKMDRITRMLERQWGVSAPVD